MKLHTILEIQKKLMCNKNFRQLFIIFSQKSNEAYREFEARVHQEFDGTICEDLGRIFLATSRLYFCSSSKLLGEVEQILEKKCPEASH